MSVMRIHCNRRATCCDVAMLLLCADVAAAAAAAVADVAVVLNFTPTMSARQQ